MGIEFEYICKKAMSSTTKRRKETSLSSLLYLLSEQIRYIRSKVSTVTELSDGMMKIGYELGSRLTDLYLSKRVIDREKCLADVCSIVWPRLFNRKVDKLARLVGSEDRYLIIERNPVLGRYISIPKEYHLSIGLITAGIVHGVLDRVGLSPIEVTAYDEGSDTIIMVTFPPRRE